jgi:predicted DCC family thiol-disulfide oxidoreductase YuxK|tara:strand:+ start:483 stop:2369 length:1887 start_codon:yes stop_codon:yes gene_type:complete
MINRTNNFLRKYFDKKIDGTGLAIFRIAYCAVLLCEIAQLFYFRHLVFDKIPYIQVAEIDFAIPISIWFISVLMILFGVYTRFSSIINYLMSLILIATISSYEYHVFYAYMGVNFLLMFIPVSQCLSIDRLFVKLKHSNTTFQYNPTKNVSQLYYFLPLFLAVGLIYFDSIFIKLMEYSWQSGLGMWMPSSLPVMVHNNISFLLNQKWIMVALGYLTLLFEASFLFLFTKKSMRMPLFLIGVGLHIGIFIVFPIPWFALTYIALYILLIPVSFWKKKRKRDGVPNLTVYYDSECPLCIRTKIVVTHFDTSNKIIFKTVQFDSSQNESLNNISINMLLDDIHCVDNRDRVYSGVMTYQKILKNIWYMAPLSFLLLFWPVRKMAEMVYEYIAKNRNTERCNEDNCGYKPPNIIEDSKFKITSNFTLNDLKFVLFKTMIFAFISFQLIIIVNSPALSYLRDKTGLTHPTVEVIIDKSQHTVVAFTKKLFGIKSHGVFIDRNHYEGYNHIIAVTYVNEDKETWLPMINKMGQPDWYNYGINWRKISFSMNSPEIDSTQLMRGVRDFTAFWAHKNNIDLNDAKFALKVKKMDSPTGWERDFINKQIAKPWINGGFVSWENEEMTSHIKDIERL